MMTDQNEFLKAWEIVFDYIKKRDNEIISPPDHVLDKMRGKYKDILASENWIDEQYISMSGSYTVEYWIEAQAHYPDYNFEWDLQSKYAGRLEWRRVKKCVYSDESRIILRHLGYLDHGDILKCMLINHGDGVTIKCVAITVSR